METIYVYNCKPYYTNGAPDKTGIPDEWQNWYVNSMYNLYHNSREGLESIAAEISTACSALWGITEQSTVVVSQLPPEDRLIHRGTGEFRILITEERERFEQALNTYRSSSFIFPKIV